MGPAFATKGDVGLQPRRGHPLRVVADPPFHLAHTVKGREELSHASGDTSGQPGHQTTQQQVMAMVDAGGIKVGKGGGVTTECRPPPKTNRCQMATHVGSVGPGVGPDQVPQPGMEEHGDVLPQRSLQAGSPRLQPWRGHTGPPKGQTQQVDAVIGG